MTPPEDEYDPNAEFVPPNPSLANDVTDDLAKLDHRIGSVKAADPMAIIPDGKYQVVVKGAKLAKGKQPPHNLMMKLEFTVVGPQFSGRSMWKNLMLATDENIGYAKRDLALCGIDIKGSADLIAATQKLPGMGLNVTVKNTGLGPDGRFLPGVSNTNVYIDSAFKQAPQQQLPPGEIPQEASSGTEEQFPQA